MALYLSFEGRIGRRQWWLGLCLLVLCWVVVYLAVVIVVGMGIAGRMALLSFTLLFLWPAAALAARRLADRGRPPMPRLALWFGPALLWSVIQVSGIGYRRVATGPGMPDLLEPGPLPVAVMALSVLALLWMTVELGVLPGRQRGSGGDGGETA